MREDVNVVFGGVGLIKGRIPESSWAMIEISKDINPYLVGDGFLRNAPFGLLNGIIRFGTKFDPYADVGRIDKKNNELPFAVEVEMAPLRRASKEDVKATFLKAIIPALFAIAARFNLPTNGLKAFSEFNGISPSPIG